MSREPPTIGTVPTNPLARARKSEEHFKQATLSAYERGKQWGFMWGIVWGVIVVIACEIFAVKYLIIWPQ